MPTVVELWKTYTSRVSNPRPLKRKSCKKADIVAELARLDSLESNQVLSTPKTNLNSAKRVKVTKPKISKPTKINVTQPDLSKTTGVTGIIEDRNDCTNKQLLSEMTFTGVKHMVEKLMIRIPRDATKEILINLIHDKQMIFPLKLEDYEMYKRMGSMHIQSLCRDVNIDPIGVPESDFERIIEDSRIRPLFIRPIRTDRYGRLSQRELKSIIKKSNRAAHPRWEHNIHTLREQVCIRTDQEIEGNSLQQILTIINMKEFQPKKKKVKKVIPMPVIIETHSDSETETDICCEPMPMPFVEKITPGEICDDDSKQSELGNDAELEYIHKPVWYKGEDIALRGLTQKDIPRLIQESKNKPVWYKGENIALRGLTEKDIPRLIQESKATPIMRLRGGGRSNRRTISQAGYGLYVAMALDLGRPRSSLLRIGSNVSHRRWVDIITALRQDYQRVFGEPLSMSAGTYHYRMTVHINGREIDVPVPGPYVSTRPMMKIKLKARIYEDALDRIAQKYESMLASAELIEITIVDSAESQAIEDLFNQGEIMSKLYASFGQTADENDANCVVQMIFDCYQKADAEKRVVTKTRDTIENQFKQICGNFDRGVTTSEIIEWADKFTDNVCVFAINPYDQRVFRKFAGRGRATINVTFVVYNGHVYPITSPAIQAAVRTTGILELEKVFWQTCPVNPLIYPDEQDLEMVIVGREEEKEDDEEESLDNVELSFPKHDWIIIESGIEQILQQVIIKHNVLVDHVKFAQSNVVAFQHPISGAMFSQSNSFEKRRDLCDVLYKAFDLENFMFSNQGYADIAKTAFKHICGNLRESEYSAEAMALSDAYSTSPINTCFDQSEESILYPRRIFDANRFYSKCCIDNSEDFPMFTAFDQIVPYHGGDIKCGEYIIKEFTAYEIIFKCQMWGWAAVKRLLELGHITKEDIIMERIARLTIRHNIMKEYIERINELTDSKQLINTMIGCLNTKERRFETGMVCLSYEEAFAHFLDRQGKGEEATINTVVYGDMTTWHVRSMKTNRLEKDNSPIWRAIISNSHIKIIELMKDLQTEFGKTTLIAIHTDAVYVENPCSDYEEVLKKHDWKPVDVENFVVVQNEEDADIVVKHTSDPENDYNLKDQAFVTIKNAIDFPMIYFEQGEGHLLQNVWEDYFTNNMRSMPRCIHVPAEEPDTTVFEPKDWTIVNDTWRNSMLITGDAGSGKTTFLRMLYREFMGEGISVVMLTFTNVARVNLLDGDDINKENVMTLDMFFLENIETPRKIPNVFIIDEVSQVNKRHMKFLYEASIKSPSTIFIFSGDFKQCLAVEAEDQIRYNWLENDTFRKLVKYNHYPKPFVAQYGRYDQEYYNVLQEFIETGYLPEYFRYGHALDPNIELSMVYTNKCRDEIIARKRLILKKNWVVGMKVIVMGKEIPKTAAKELREMGVFNNARLVITELLSETHAMVKVRGQDEDIQMNLKYVLPLFASTVYKNQAVTIDSHVNIVQLERMDKNQAYTALSRVRKGEHIHVKWCAEKFEPMKIIESDQCKLRMARVKTVWVHNGKIQEEWQHENDYPARILYEDVDDLARIIRNKNAINKAQVAPEAARRKFTTKVTKFFSKRKGYHTCFKITVRGNYDGYKQTERIKFDHTDDDSVYRAYQRAVELAANLEAAVDLAQKRVKKNKVKANKKDAQDRKHEKMKPRDYECKERHIPRNKCELQTYGEFRKLNWYKKQAPVDVLEGRTIKWVEPAPNPTKKYPYTHSFASAPVDLILEQMKNIEGPFYGYEVLDHNVRLYADIDKELEDGEEVDIEYYIYEVTRACINVAATYGTRLKEEDFRYLNATTDKKMSLHISNVAHVFQTTTCQEEFWLQVASDLKNIPGCWFEEDKKKCIIDLKVYTKHRAMRMIHASKPGKQNRLVPVNSEGIILEQYINEEYLIMVENWTNDYTILSAEKEIKKNNNSRRGTAVSSGVVPDDIRLWMDENPVDGFDTTNVQWDGSTCRLTRISSSHCNECNKIHDGDNARFEFNLATHEVKYRCFRGKTPIHMGFY